MIPNPLQKYDKGTNTTIFIMKNKGDNTNDSIMAYYYIKKYIIN